MKAIVTVDLGFGDAGKGSVVDYLCREHNADLVVRYNGGHQAAHHVVIGNGVEHTFAQFGSGTMADVPTYIGPNVIVEPFVMEREANALIKKGFDPWQGFKIHPDCLVTTPFHKLMNRIKEQFRRKGFSSHGSCGVGIGETRKYWLDYGYDAINVQRLSDMNFMKSRLRLMRQRYLIEAQEYVCVNNADLISEMYHIDINDLVNKYLHFDNHIMPLMAYSAELPLPGYHPDYINRDESPTIIFEGAQGVLLDEYYGFHPHTTWSTTTPLHALELMEESGFEFETEVLGVTRTYMTRHGNGPMPSEDDTLKFPDHNKKEEYQGDFRFGYLDIPLIEYALRCCDGTMPVDYLFVNHVDQMPSKVSHCYGGVDFSSLSELRTPIINLDKQSKIFQMSTIDFPYCFSAVHGDALKELQKLRPIKYTGHGPTYKDKLCTNCVTQ